MEAVAGPTAEKIGLRSTVEEMVGVHEAAHVVLQFLLGRRLAGASIIPWEGHSLGRASSCKPTPEMLKAPPVTDEQRTRDYALLGGPNRAELEAATEKLLSDYWPLVRALAAVLVQRKVVSGRPGPADSLSRAAQESATLAYRRGKGPPQSAGLGRGISPRPRQGGRRNYLAPEGAPRAPGGPKGAIGARARHWTEDAYPAERTRPLPTRSPNRRAIRLYCASVSITSGTVSISSSS
jgi:hypothetical protein